LAIGCASLRIHASAEVVRALATFHDEFVVHDDVGSGQEGDFSITVDAVDDEKSIAWSVPEPASVTPNEFGLEIRSSAVHADLDPVEKTARVHHSGDIGGVDLVIRAALSAALLSRSALLMHAAVLEGSPGPALVCGESGAGKSTASRSLGGACDELAVLKVNERVAQIFSTPYWSGRPYHAHVDRVLCLRRSAERPGVRTLRGSAALRTLARHVVRYFTWPEGEAAILGILGAIGERVQVLDVACPEGSSFIPFLRGVLETPAT
jgi:hypothetical protein